MIQFIYYFVFLSLPAGAVLELPLAPIIEDKATATASALPLLTL